MVEQAHAFSINFTEVLDIRRIIHDRKLQEYPDLF